MYTKTTKLYPISEKNRKPIADFMSKLFEITEDEESEEWNLACEIASMLHDMAHTTDGKVAWITGKQIALAKVVLAKIN